MNLYISDLHFGHRDIIGFDHRPFGDVEEMDQVLIKLWNDRVFEDDHVFIVGDLLCGSDKHASWYLSQMKGHKHLIIGNHDEGMLDDDRAMSYFESVDYMKTVVDVYEGRKIKVFLCHYPMVSWGKETHGNWHIYGHIHSVRLQPYEAMQTISHTLNAAACINNYTPVSFRELYENNVRFRSEE